MKKFILTIAFIASGLVASAQVGIGNTDPKATLDVTGVATAGVPDGVLVPRFTVAQLNTKAAAYTADQNSALVFVTDFTGAAHKTSNVTATGFHYYNSTTDKWVSLAGSVQQYQNIRGGVEEINAAATISNNSYFVIFDGAVTSDITMPAAALGKTLWLKNVSASGINANVLNVFLGTAAGSLSITTGKMRCFVSDGTNWYASNQ